MDPSRRSIVRWWALTREWALSIHVAKLIQTPGRLLVPGSGRLAGILQYYYVDTHAVCKEDAHIFPPPNLSLGRITCCATLGGECTEICIVRCEVKDLVSDPLCLLVKEFCQTELLALEENGNNTNCEDEEKLKD